MDTTNSSPRPQHGSFDRRLLRWARATRRYLGLTVIVGCTTAALVVVQAWLLADIVARAFGRSETLAALRAPILALLAVIIARAVVGWASEGAAHRASAAAKSQLRLALVRHVTLSGPQDLGLQRPGALATLATSDIDALDAYFSRYLPQVFLAAIVPVVVVVVVAGTDWVSAAIVAVTVPLIPLFMSLIGSTTRQQTERKMRTLHRLAGHFLDVVAGLPTLKVFGRAKAQARIIRDITGRYREATMATLRLAFLSSLVLELVATLSVALVAVAIGLRLLGGRLDLETALFVLVLAPEAYLPLRALATHYHASTDGMEAAGKVFQVLERPGLEHGHVKPDARPSLHAESLTVTYPGRSGPALGPISLNVEPGEVVAIAGPSGCGKSTLLNVLLGFVPPASGSVTLGGVALADIDIDTWREQLAWVPQRPHLFATTIAENVRLGRQGASTRELARACQAAGLEAVLGRLPLGLDTRLGDDGAGLSAGERQRVALARAFVRNAPLLLLDEPTAGLDGRTEQEVLAAVRRLMADRTVVLVAHRPALLALADRIIHVAPQMVAS